VDIGRWEVVGWAPSAGESDGNALVARRMSEVVAERAGAGRSSWEGQVGVAAEREEAQKPVGKVLKGPERVVDIGYSEGAEPFAGTGNIAEVGQGEAVEGESLLEEGNSGAEHRMHTAVDLAGCTVRVAVGWRLAKLKELVGDYSEVDSMFAEAEDNHLVANMLEPYSVFVDEK
jgi:hypothetical protein